jgi:LPXTG-motif cell wall-anchored protein
MQKAGEDNTKWYILGGAAALLAAALVWQSYADEVEVENAEKFDNDDIKELLKKEKLDVVKKDGNMINA